MESQISISVKHLVKVYRQGTPDEVKALDGLSLDVRKGEIFGLLGRNGAGKTTLLRILTTLIQPTSGSVELLGIDVVRNPLKARQQICAVLQENAVEIFLSVMDNFATYARFHAISTSEIRRRAERVIALFGLEEYKNQKVIDLSAGLKRRVQVAKVFMVEKPIVFLDEATTGMDLVNKRATLDAIREQARRGRTIFLTTHILQEAEELCDMIAIIDHGRCVASGDLAMLRSLVETAYDVNITCEQVTEELLQRIRAFPVVALTHKHTTIALTLRGTSRDAFDLLTMVKHITPILHFEVTSASLEDVFLRLLDRQHPLHHDRAGGAP